METENKSSLYGLIKVVVTALLIIAISWLWELFVSPHLFATTINQLLLLFINATGKTVLALGIGFYWFTNGRCRMK